MNNSSSAKNGFKTFILTLSISLIVFSVIYYFISESQSGVALGTSTEETSVQSFNTVDKEDEAVAEESVFKKLADAGTTAPAVLAGTTTSTTGTTASTTGTTVTTTTTTPTVVTTSATTAQSTLSAVPTTGATEITIGLIMSALAFALGLFVISKNPRKLALSSFEKRITKGL